MRVTGGRMAGRMLQLPKGPRIRATQDQVRQALFNLVGERVEGARVLDLFCGCGAVGIEALSRGAAHVTFVDRSGFSVEATRENLRRCQVDPAPSVRVMRSDAAAAVRRLARGGEKFDILFLDPPYGRDLATKALNALEGCAIVSASGWVIIEQGKRDPPPLAVPGTAPGSRQAPGTAFWFQRLERYGDTAIVIYEKQ